jgi:SagB-type dehydrogenase family enzyme
VKKDNPYALDYHEKTKHSEISVMTSNYYLDWSNRPSPFKIYTELPSTLLPLDFSIPSMNAILAISNLYPSQYKQFKINNKSINTTEYFSIDNDDIKTKNKNGSQTLTLKDIATILFFSAGITRKIKFDGGIFYMRAASATGALYPIEMYILCKDIYPDLKAGIYHFNPAEFSLTNIREGDYSQLLSSLAADNQHILKSPVTIIFTSYAWRNAWKYQDRSFRHWFWDSGVMVSNLLATTTSMNFTAKVIMGFIDDEVNCLLALEKEKEASVAMVALDIDSLQKYDSENKITKKEQITDLAPPKIIPLSREEIQYPNIWKTYERSKLFNEDETKEWLNSGLVQPNTFLSFNEYSIPPREQILKRQELSSEYNLSNIPTIGETILRRGSTRRFARSPISYNILSSILYNSTRGISIDFKKDEESLIDIYLIANDVKGTETGAYFYNRSHNSLDLLKDKVSRNLSGYLCLNQALFSDASVVLFLMSNLNNILKTLGTRGYSAAQFEGGIIAGKIYLSSYAHGIGASGSTFYDDAVTEFFSPHSKDKNTMIAVGIGNPSYKARQGKILQERITREQLIRNTQSI